MSLMELLCHSDHRHPGGALPGGDCKGLGRNQGISWTIQLMRTDVNVDRDRIASPVTHIVHRSHDAD